MIVELKTHPTEGTKLISVNGSKCTNQKFVSQNGWKVTVNYDGSVMCTSKETVEGKYYETTLKISKDGVVRISQMSKGVRKELSHFRAKKWSDSTFILVLTDDTPGNRKAFLKNK